MILRKIVIPYFNWMTWKKVCETWAEIHDGMVTIRYQKHLFPGMHVVAGNDRFKITGVIDRPGKTRLVELHIQEIRASAELPDALQR
jgi:hypothetical protein